VRCGAHDVLGERVHPLLQLDLVLGEIERDGHASILPAPTPRRAGAPASRTAL